MRSLSWAAVALALAACTEPRKLVLSIDTNAGVPCDIDRIQIRATAAGATMFDRSLDGAHLPVSVTLLDGTPSGSFDLELTGLKGDAAVMRVTGPLQFAGRAATQPVMLDINCPVDAPCPLSGAMAAGAAATAGLTRFQCGPDVQRYAAATTAESFVDACKVPGSITGNVLGDGSTGPVPLDKLQAALPGFAFQFYGQPVHQIWVSRDGYLSFTRDNPDPDHVLVPGPFDRGIRHVGAPPPPQSVMAFWDTLALTSSGVCYELEGSSGSQRIRVTWHQACFTQPPCSSGPVNVTVTLDESTQRVVLAYQISPSGDQEKGATATVGLVDGAAGCPVDQCALDTGLCQDGVTLCGYSQVFSDTVQANGVGNMQFMPISKP
jgi:hypothetical protein